MKNYLFRGFSKLHNKWIYGGVAFVGKDVFICGTGKNPRELTFTLVDSESVGQWTGFYLLGIMMAESESQLINMNPKIFEGDILRDYNGKEYEVDFLRKQGALYGGCFLTNMIKGHSGSQTSILSNHLSFMEAVVGDTYSRNVLNVGA